MSSLIRTWVCGAVNMDLLVLPADPVNQDLLLNRMNVREAAGINQLHRKPNVDLQNKSRKPWSKMEFTSACVCARAPGCIHIPDIPDRPSRNASFDRSPAPVSPPVLHLKPLHQLLWEVQTLSIQTAVCSQVHVYWADAELLYWSQEHKQEISTSDLHQNAAHARMLCFVQEA